MIHSVCVHYSCAGGICPSLVSKAMWYGFVGRENLYRLTDHRFERLDYCVGEKLAYWLHEKRSKCGCVGRLVRWKIHTFSLAYLYFLLSDGPSFFPSLPLYIICIYIYIGILEDPFFCLLMR